MGVPKKTAAAVYRAIASHSTMSTSRQHDVPSSDLQRLAQLL